nr:hypothetical protein [Tanacetum cinerariifolium]
VARHAAEHAMVGNGHLRGPRQGPDQADGAGAAARAGHLCRARPPRGDRAPQADRRHRARAAADPGLHPGSVPAGKGPQELL